MFNKLKQIFCKHDFKYLKHEKHISDNSNSDLKIVLTYETTYKCTKCGKEKITRWDYP